MTAIHSIDPHSGAVLATFPEDTANELERKLAGAAAAVPLLRAAGVKARASWLARAAEILDEEVDECARLITAEMGKPLAQARAEVAKCARALRYYAANGAAFLEGERLENPASVGASWAGTRYEPMGVVLAIMPWNYPFWQVVRFAAPALAAGNVGLLKHAPNVPQSAAYLGSLFQRAGFPPGAFGHLFIDVDRVEQVIRDDRVEAVTITGSDRAGRAVAAIAGDAIKKVVLELGGSDPFIVMPSSDLDAAVRTAVAARTSNNGQACINAKRFIVHADVYQQFSERFVEAMRQLIVGDPTEPTTDVGPIVSSAARDLLVEQVEDARGKGGEILTGGTVDLDRAGWYFPPTVVASLTRGMRLWGEEAFGPVASLYRVDSLDEALSLANDTDYGLGSAFWSTDTEEIATAVDQLEAGAVFVNGMTLSFPELPFGGRKRSGFGRELAAEGVREFCNLKTVWTA